MDKECSPLCCAMNSLPGVTTVESCCGHGNREYRIWFMVGTLDALPKLLYWFDGCHSSYYGWRVTVRTDCSKAPAIFCVEGPTGEQAYSESNHIARLIMADDE